MDTKGIVIGLKLALVLAVLSVLVLIGRLTGVIKKADYSNGNITVTPTGTVTPTPTTIGTSQDIDNLSADIDKSGADIDKLDSELNGLDSSLSSTEIDSKIVQINNLK